MLQIEFTKDYYDVFIAFFREMIGDLGGFDEISENVSYMWVLYFFFFTATFLLVISMLNLLIAIISDTFSRVKNAENLTKVWERWNIITEIDDMRKGNNKKEIKQDNGKSVDVDVKKSEKKKEYLMILYNEHHFPTEINDVEFKISMDEFRKKSEKFQEKIERKQEEFKEILDKIWVSLQESSQKNSKKE